MSDITKTFFLARDPGGAKPYRGINHVPLQGATHQLVFETYKPGDGPRMQAFLTGEVATGEPKSRKLPKEVANEVARLVNEHRHSGKLVDQPGYVIQMVATGSPELHWTLEKLSIKTGRFDQLNAAKAGAAIKQAAEQGKQAVMKSDLENLGIKVWERAIHYTVNLITFGSYNDMEIWARRHERSPLFAKDAFQVKAIKKPKEPLPWFETLNWQRLPSEFIARMDSGARELVFPTNLQMIEHAVHAAPGPLLIQPFTILWELIKEHGEHGPHNCVHALFKADVRVVLAEGII